MPVLPSRRALARPLRGAAIVAALAIPLGLFVLGAQPVAVGLVPSPWDKLAHGGVFFLLAGAIGLACGVRDRRVLLLAVAGAAVIGGLDELHQIFLPGRQAGWDDFAADAVGSVLGGIALATGWRLGESPATSGV